MVPASIEATPPEAPPVHILVVEDEIMIRFVIAEALRDLGAHVIEASTADEAWHYLHSGAAVDLVFTDHRMPGSMSGADLAQRIREEFPGMQVIVTSAHFYGQPWPTTVLNKPYDLFRTASDLVRQATLSRQIRRSR